jgi:NDP-sugar pyrophosphorylase family protein
MRAVIMAGGLGTRLAPYTTVLPKPLMPLCDRPILDVILRQLAEAGIEHVTISVGHLGGILEAWVRHADDFGVPVDFMYESEPLGTAGALGVLHNLEGSFLAMNGDILTTMDFAELAAHHRRDSAIATVAVTNRTVDIEYGVVRTDSDGALGALEEKPQLRYLVSMGVYAFDASITRHIQPGERIDFPDLLLRARSRGDRVGTFQFDGYWRDIGNRDDYELAVSDFAADSTRFVRDSR